MKPDKLARRWQKQEARAELEAKGFARRAVRDAELDAMLFQAMAPVVAQVAADVGLPGPRRQVSSNRLVLRSDRRC